MIVADSTPLIYFSKINELHLLEKVFGKIIISDGVYDEVVVKGEERDYPDAKALRKRIGTLIEIVPIPKKQHTIVDEICGLANIGRAEAESIVLARERKLPLIMDDIVGVRMAKMYGVETYWSTSVVLKAVGLHVVTKSKGKELIEELVLAGLRIKQDVLIELMRVLS